MTHGAGDQDTPNSGQAVHWNAAAGETWAALQARIDRQIGPLGLRAMDALAVRPGERLIDIGCGCGDTSLELARRAGATGAVLGVDVSAPMLAVARRRAAAANAPGLSFLQSDAQTCRFAPGSADGLFSRFGVMFFADPTAAFANLRAALTPAGRLAFVCWRAMELNPFMTAPLDAARPLLPTPSEPPPLHAPGPFALADPDRLTAILSAAGFSDIDLLPHDQAIGGEDLEASVDYALRLGPLGAVLREQPALAPIVTDAVREALARYERPEGVLLPSASWIVTARTQPT